MKELKNSMNKQLVFYADIVDYKPPTITNGLSQRPDIVIADINRLYVIELTLGLEKPIMLNAERKKKL